MSRLFSRVVIFVLSLAVVFVSTVTNTTYAAEDLSKADMSKVLEQLESFAAQKADIDPEVEKELLKKASKDLKSYSAHLPKRNIDLKKSSVLHLKNNGTSMYTVAFPYKDIGQTVKTSGIQFYYNKDKQKVKTVEMVLSDVNDEIGNAKIWRNGELVIDKNVDKTSAPEINIEGQCSEDEVSTQGFFGCMNNCLASLGLPSWAIGVFATVCGAACATPPTCAICVEAALLAYAVELNYCIGKCS
ncbi:hypothetical protein JOD24_000728 [Kroppenstedtia sanguinis]|uniref:hypothetical protein n=1 Tax=Kroppenstedtia sanguinis TaxID=1380684 RepID=UPI003D24400C